MNPYRNAFNNMLANARFRHYGGDLEEYRPDDYEASTPICEDCNASHDPMIACPQPALEKEGR